MELEHVSDWNYKAEGNKHIVVCNGKGKCLRLLKLNGKISENINSINRSNEKQETSSLKLKLLHEEWKPDELNFVKCVVLPLMHYCDACHIPKVIKISELFLRDLDLQIKKDRPKHRRSKAIDVNVPSLLMDDHCFIPFTKNSQAMLKNGAVLDHVLTVEIKLKKGCTTSLKSSQVGLSEYLSFPICQFCTTQVYKVMYEQKYKRCSFYCPLDLFSGNEARMKMALFSLISTPQNNFRLFKDGNLVFSQESIDSISFGDSSHNNVDTNLYNFLSSCLSPIVSSDDTKLSQIECFVELLYKALLLPVVPTTNFLSSHIAHCHGATYKERICNQKRQHTFPLPANHSKVTETSSLPASCILNVILMQQRLDSCSLRDIYNDYQTLNSNLKSDPSLQDDLSVDAPYNSSGWQHFISNHCCNIKTVENGEVLWRTADRLRRFLVSKSFSDCSIMVSFQKIKKMTSMASKFLDNLTCDPPSAHFNIISDSKGNYFIVSIAVVDTDPKSSCRIPEYFKRHMDIALWWKEVMDFETGKKSSE